MITIDRDASASVKDQLVEQLRFEIASGRYKVADTLPSTRGLADQVGVSFHTVRKAYHQLQEEGLVESRPGTGFVVEARAPLNKEERMERGAAVIHEVLQKLIGLGLRGSEVEYLVQEQLSLIDDHVHARKLLFAAPYREMAEPCAKQVALTLQQDVDPVAIDELGVHQDADYVFARCADLQSVMKHVPRVDAVGVVTYLSPEVLQRLARLLPSETLGLVTRYPDAVPLLMSDIRVQTGFSGQTLGASLQEGARHVQQFIRQVDVLVFTPSSRRRLSPLFDGYGKPHYEMDVIVSADSLDAVRQAVPS